ncbi:metallophosphoesterase [Robertmurraya kyonggiensis]|uniref:Metallophosphoesterase n=1 Tax=Robertmurraya kyonggiensis TaxID=1037680 RepID=A0A4U1D8D7_9BACI|nr:metallophosphoesterase [Robertmurraya kyonggiensis]TKC18825.1 metallophosphoesterase [Robertmurraya kyonggiensis]
MSTVGMVLGIILMLSLYGGMNFFIGRRIFQFLRFPFPHLNGKVFAGIYIVLALSLMIGILPLPPEIKAIMSWIGSYWMGIFVYLLILLLVAELVILLGRLIKVIPRPIPKSIRFYKGAIVLLLTIGLVSYGMYNANQIKQVSYEIQTKESTMATEMKIVMISDLHLGAVNSEKHLESIVQGINNLDPDLVCLVGDVFNDDFNAIRNPDRAIELLKSIKATYGVYSSLGNHDGGNTFNEMTSFLQESNIKLLNDEYEIIDERLVLFGRVDPTPIGGFGDLKRKDTKDIMKTVASLHTNMPVVMMDHNPANIEEYGNEVDLIISGHTHKGQIFPGNLITNALYIVDYGHYQKDAESPHVIVSSGVGTWAMPMRIGSNSEIVSISLR